MDATGAASSAANFFRSRFGMESGPGDLDFLIALRWALTSSTET